MVTLKYTINGAQFRRKYADDLLAQAMIRKQVLEGNGITVQLKLTKHLKQS